jgi:hypothetical protein
MENASAATPVDRIVICGSEEWLRRHAFFVCDYCSAGDEPTCHAAKGLKMWAGKTICDQCWDNMNDDSLPQSWQDLDTFEPFEFLSR